MRALAAALALCAAVGAAAADDAGVPDAAPGSGAKVIQIPLDASAPQVSASASPTVAKLGGHFTLFVEATFADGVVVNLREPVDLSGAFEVRRRLSEDKPRGDGRTTREWQLDVTPWELGDLQIPPIAVTFTANGHAGQVETNAVPMKIVGELGDVVDDPKLMRGLASPTTLVVRDWFWIWTTIAGAAVIGASLGWLAWSRLARRRTRALVGGTVAAPRRLDMTGARALEQLRAIADSGALARDAERKAAYAEMVGVIRDYLGARYRIATHELTSAELLRALAAAPAATAEEVALVDAWLADCDAVRYGGASATPADGAEALDDARAVIVTTTALADAAARTTIKSAPPDMEAA